MALSFFRAENMYDNREKNLKGERDMFWKKKQKDQSELEKEMEQLEFQMQALEDKTSKEYLDCLCSYEKLVNLDNKRKSLVVREKLLGRISPDAIVAAVVNIGGILLVLHYEEARIIVSKAWNMVSKGRFK